MEIKDLPLNDEWVQCLRSMRKRTDDYTEKRKEEMRNCNHLFVRLKEGVTITGFNSSDCYYDPSEVESVHCGLTNKHMFLEKTIEDYKLLNFYTTYNKRTLETEMFNEIFRNYYRRGGKSFDESGFNLISEEILNTYHPGLLYQLAIKINPNASNEQIFNIMKRLKEIETRQEQLRLKNIEEAQDLIERYKINKPKKLIKK